MNSQLLSKNIHEHMVSRTELDCVREKLQTALARAETAEATVRELTEANRLLRESEPGRGAALSMPPEFTGKVTMAFSEGSYT